MIYPATYTRRIGEHAYYFWFTLLSLIPNYAMILRRDPKLVK
ncbi:hypothetical protein PsAD46_01839 [Pseudovibrio sp. Ad46]|nr:hypothetical protein PsAD46_01839 [Pseudovibrio sp. Ad46]KZK97435.1 hypothetical protein PsAD5_02284 [Pseudovibrio sp. Ad5]